MCLFSDLNQFENVCRNTTESCEGSQEKKSHLQRYLYVFMLGNALHGAGSTPMFTLGTAFIDENTKAEMTSLYLGMYDMYGLCKKKILADTQHLKISLGMRDHLNK